MDNSEVKRLVEKFYNSCTYCTKYGACPFAYTEISEQVNNYGCLPTPKEIIDMRVEKGLTWACHSNLTKPCLGAINYLREHNLPFKVINKELVTEENRLDLCH